MNLNKIKGLCKKNGMTIRQLEKAANLGTNSIYKWGSQSPAVDKVKRVADLLSVPVEELLKDEPA